jgi:hypothetical protein
MIFLKGLAIMKKANLSLLVYVVVVLALTPLTTLAAHSIGHVGGITGAAVFVGLLAGFTLRVITHLRK